MASRPIDLTGNDSDSEDQDGPLAKLFPPRPRPVEKHTKNPLPMPENVRHLYPSASAPTTSQFPRAPYNPASNLPASNLPTNLYPNNHLANTSAPSPSFSPYASPYSVNATLYPDFPTSNTTVPPTAQPPKLNITTSNASNYKDYVTVHRNFDGLNPGKRRKTSASSTPPVPMQGKRAIPVQSLNKPPTAVTPPVVAPSVFTPPAVKPSAIKPVPAKPSVVTPSPATPPTHVTATPSVNMREEECHFLIYLKEVKKLRWDSITAVFNEHYPGRSYPKLQTTYSSKLNKRDRAEDPPTWTLPPGYDPEESSSLPTAPIYKKKKSEPRQTDSLHTDSIPSPQTTWQEPIASVEHSAGVGVDHRRERPRRAVPNVDYTWARLRRSYLGEEEMEMDNNGIVDEVSEEPPESLKSAPEVAIPIDNAPLVPYSFEKEDALLAVSTKKQRRPYLSSSERSTLQSSLGDLEWDQLASRDWQGSLIHVDFNHEELKAVQKSICKVLDTSSNPQYYSRKHLQNLLQDLSESKFYQIQHEACKNLPHRGRKSVKAFLTDAQTGHIRVMHQKIERLAAARPNKDLSTTPKASITSMVSDRELGSQSRRGWKAASRPVSYQMKNKVQDTLGPSSTYTGASSDVHAIAWSPDGESFIAGAICVDDPHSMQYNKGNNLLYGDLMYGTMHELGGHRVPRPRTESGPNSTHAMFASQDPNLYKTVSSVLFSPDGRYAYSSGYDHKVCIWDTEPDHDSPSFNQPKWSGAWKHKAPVDIMIINSSGILATASKKSSTNAIKIIRVFDDDFEKPVVKSFSSQKATSKPEYNILPTALRFSPRFENLLLAGFGANARNDGRDVCGDICMWDVNRPDDPLNIMGSNKNVFDLAFHPRFNCFAAGCVAGSAVNRGTRSVVRVHDTMDNNKYSMQMELECKALDMNDVVWCPGNDFLIAAGCTSGRAYVWDIRRPDCYLCELAHARSLMPLDEYREREVTDTGIRFLSWGDNATRLYTGSSDGVVKVWNVVISDEETFVKDLITTDSGIMCGAFSPDKSKLLLGDINGSINVLEVGQEDWSLKEARKFNFIPYDDKAEREAGSHEAEQQPELPAKQNQESGIHAATELLKSGQMRYESFGGLPIRQAVQGPNYAGPFDNSVDSPFLRQQALNFQLSLSTPKGPQCSLSGCNDAVVRVTSEEIGDSGRSSDRIGDELRQARKRPQSDVFKAIPGKSRCQKCSGIARPSTSEQTFCERCSFACFRCCQPCDVPSDTKVLKCPHCEHVWEIGALGYEWVSGNSGRPDLDGIVPALGKLRVDDGDGVGDGEETDDYYFRQAMERPTSPPL